MFIVFDYYNSIYYYLTTVTICLLCLTTVTLAEVNEQIYEELRYCVEKLEAYSLFVREILEKIDSREAAWQDLLALEVIIYRSKKSLCTYLHFVNIFSIK